jgi:hypothetical protein
MNAYVPTSPIAETFGSDDAPEVKAPVRLEAGNTVLMPVAPSATRIPPEAKPEVKPAPRRSDAPKEGNGDRVVWKGEWETHIPDALFNSHMSARACWLWCCLKRFVGKNSPNPYPKVFLLRSLMGGCGKDNFQAARKELETRGWLETARRTDPQTGYILGNIYTLMVPEKIRKQNLHPSPSLPATAAPSPVSPVPVNGSTYKDPQSKEYPVRRTTNTKEAAGAASGGGVSPTAGIPPSAVVKEPDSAAVPPRLQKWTTKRQWRKEFATQDVSGMEDEEVKCALGISSVIVDRHHEYLQRPPKLKPNFFSEFNRLYKELVESGWKYEDMIHVVSFSWKKAGSEYPPNSGFDPIWHCRRIKKNVNLIFSVNSKSGLSFLEMARQEIKYGLNLEWEDMKLEWSRMMEGVNRRRAKMEAEERAVEEADRSKQTPVN